MRVASLQLCILEKAKERVGALPFVCFILGFSPLFVYKKVKERSPMHTGGNSATAKALASRKVSLCELDQPNLEDRFR